MLAWNCSSSSALHLFLLLSRSLGHFAGNLVWRGPGYAPPRAAWRRGDFCRKPVPASQQKLHGSCIQFRDAKPTAFVWEWKEWFYLMTC